MKKREKLAALADRHIIEGELRLTQQERLVEQMDRSAFPVSAGIAEALLEQCRAHLQEAYSLRRRLNAPGMKSTGLMRPMDDR